MPVRPSPPLITLGVGALLAGGLVVANVVNSARAEEAVAADAVAADVTPAATPEPPTPATPPNPATPEPPAPATPPAPDVPAVTSTYTGTVAGTALTAAISVTGDEAVAYVCDGELVEIWLSGSTADGVLDLAGAGGETITGTVTPDVVAGDSTTYDGGWSLSATAEGWPDWAPPVPASAGQE